MSRATVRSLNPFILKDGALFPEWYASFKAKFSRYSSAHAAYIVLPTDQSLTHFSGPPEVVKSTIEAVIRCFHDCIVELLPQFVDPDGIVLHSRTYVETTFAKHLQVTYPRREGECSFRTLQLLRSSSIHNYEAYFNHFMSSDKSELLWSHMFAVFVGHLIKDPAPHVVQELSDTIKKAISFLDAPGHQIAHWITLLEESPTLAP